MVPGIKSIEGALTDLVYGFPLDKLQGSPVEDWLMLRLT